MRDSIGINIGLYILAISLACMTACDSDSCLHGTGEKSTIRIATGFFETLNVQGILDIILVQDTTCFVEFEGGDKVLEYASAVNTESAVWLNNSNRCFFLRDYEKIKAFVHFTHLNKIDLFEVCKVESRGALDSLSYMTVQGPMAEVDITFNTDRFGFYNNQTTGGLYTFRGICDKLYLGGYYTAKINLADLMVREMNLNNSSLSDIYVNASELLTIQIHNKGNIYYSGSPQIVIDSVSGSGRLLPWIKEGDR
jgi:hypothetical protein